MSPSEEDFGKKDIGLRVDPYRGFNPPFPKFGKPERLGFFSVTTDNDYEASARNLRYYKAPKCLPLDLNIDWRMGTKNSTQLFSFYLLKFIYEHKEQFLIPSELPTDTKRGIAVEFICWRGLLTLIMQAPYNLQDIWTIHVTKYLGSFYLYLATYTTPREPKTEEHEKKSAFRNRFLQHCLSESPSTQAKPDKPFDEFTDFMCVFKRKVENMELLYTASIDGIISNTPVQLDDAAKINTLRDLKFVSVKLREERVSPRQKNNYKIFKSRTWWCSSFFAGIEDNYVGVRSEEGLLESFEHVKTHTLPSEGLNYWRPSVCGNFLVKFLTVIRKVMAAVNCPYTVYEFCYNPETLRVTYECFKGKTERSFLPDWYLSMFQNEATDENTTS